MGSAIGIAAHELPTMNEVRPTVTKRHQRHPFEVTRGWPISIEEAGRIQMVGVADPLKRPRQEQNQRGRNHPLQTRDPGTQSLLQRQRARPNGRVPPRRSKRETPKTASRARGSRVRKSSHRAASGSRSRGRPPGPKPVRSAPSTRGRRATRPNSRASGMTALRAQFDVRWRIRLDGRKNLRIRQLRSAQVALRRRPPFGAKHRPEIVAEKDRQGREHQHQDRIEAIGQARQERRRRDRRRFAESSKTVRGSCRARPRATSRRRPAPPRERPSCRRETQIFPARS